MTGSLEQAAMGFAGETAVNKKSRLAKLGYEPTPENEAILRRLVSSDAGCMFVTNFGGLLIRELRLEKAGDYHQGHRHAFDHVTMLFKGKVECEIPGEKTLVYEAPAAIPIAAEKWHKFTALEDDVIYFCVFSNQSNEEIPLSRKRQAGSELQIDDDELKAFMNQAGASPIQACSGCVKACEESKS